MAMQKDCLKEKRLDDDEKLIEDIFEKHPDLRHYSARTKKKRLRFQLSYPRASLGVEGKVGNTNVTNSVFERKQIVYLVVFFSL